MDLIADIGATNTRCALLDDKGRLVSPEAFRNADFTGIEGLLRVYLEHRRASDWPKRAALAVAAPILGDEVEMINIDWRFSQTALKQSLSLNRLLVINDFAAQAWALPAFSAQDIEAVGGGQSAPGTPRVVLGPGSGLGVSALLPAVDGWTAVSGEGGHATLPATDEEQEAVIRIIRESIGHCSMERVLSGPGLVRLYMALGRLAGRDVADVKPADVTRLASKGEPLARKTQDMFFAFLGTVASDLALTFGARGGVFLSGGILPHLIQAMAASSFRESFENKGRYREYLGSVPTYVVTADMPALKGLRSLLGYR